MNYKYDYKYAITYISNPKTPERKKLAMDISNFIMPFIGACLLVDLKKLDNNNYNKYNIKKVIAVGGDGVLIGSTHLFKNEGVKFVLVGAPGKSASFYSQINYDNYRYKLHLFITDNCQYLKGTRIQAYAKIKEHYSHYSLNEIAFLPTHPGQTFRYELTIKGDGKFIGRNGETKRKYKGASSSLLFSTPFGPTAWSMSAHGPVILDKEAEVVIITPESPQNSIRADPYNNKNVERDRYGLLGPIVVPQWWNITLKLLTDTTIIVDGRFWENLEIERGTEINIERENPVLIAIFEED